MWKAKPTQEGFAFQVRSDSIAALSASDQLQASRSSPCVAAEVAARLEVMGVRGLASSTGQACSQDGGPAEPQS